MKLGFVEYKVVCIVATMLGKFYGAFDIKSRV